MAIVARPRVLPSDKELVAMRDRGMTHQEIADEVKRTTGFDVARSTVSVALMRAGESQHKLRYEDTIPWTVPARFQAEYQLRMLRLLGRTRNGQPMSDDEADRLDSWLRMLEEDNLIVVFCPNAPVGEKGFYYAPVEAKDHGNPDLPIRKREVLPGDVGF